MKYPRVRDEQGKPLEILSTFGEESVGKDALAFSKLMRHIREIDSIQQTFVMMQVENEVGVLDMTGKSLGNARKDFSDAANAAYKDQVPAELMSYLTSNSLLPTGPDGIPREALCPRFWTSGGRSPVN